MRGCTLAHAIILIMGITFVVYCAVAFTNLGSTKAPQTAWVSVSPKIRWFSNWRRRPRSSLLYYAGVSYHNFTVSVSERRGNLVRSHHLPDAAGALLPLAVRDPRW